MKEEAKRLVELFGSYYFALKCVEEIQKAILLTEATTDFYWKGVGLEIKKIRAES